MSNIPDRIYVMPKREMEGYGIFTPSPTTPGDIAYIRADAAEAELCRIKELAKRYNAGTDFRFTTGAGSALLYYGDEFVAKVTAKHTKALSAVLVANSIMREEIDGFTKHVGAETFQDAVDVLIRGNAQNVDIVQKQHDAIKKQAAERDAAETERAEIVAALAKIEKWFGEFPETGRKWDDGEPMSYSATFGSNGERDYMRQVAREALSKLEGGAK